MICNSHSCITKTQTIKATHTQSQKIHSKKFMKFGIYFQISTETHLKNV